MKKLSLTTITVLFLTTGAAQAQFGEPEFIDKLAKFLHDHPNMILKCEEFTFSARDGKLIFHLPESIFAGFELRGDDFYFGGRRCEPVEIRCDKQTSC